MGRRWRRRRRNGVLFFFCALLLFAAAWIATRETETPEREATPLPLTPEGEIAVDLYLVEEDKTITLDLEDYIVGVVAAEVPANFEPEALKAQAIVARTYSVRKINAKEAGETDQVHEAALCDSFAHCQAYCDDEEMREKWGDQYEEYSEKIRQAVEDTRDLVVLYEGEIALTPYHSTCGGKTASAEEVWGEAYPYLVSVDCDLDTDAPRYTEDFAFALADIPWLLGEDGKPCIALSSGEEADEVPEIMSETESGRVAVLSYGGLEFAGTDFREKMGINSTNFTFEVEGDELLIHTQGFGHGVGLCQHGANGMAKEGKTAEEIIAHYYVGTEIGSID